MGNRAIVKPVGLDVGVYLHWYGGVKNIEAFLAYCKMKKYRGFGGTNADSYGVARFVQVVGNFLGGGLSIGIVSIPKDVKKYAEESWLDNGLYLVDEWDIVGHYGFEPYSYEDEDKDGLKYRLLGIDGAQPQREQLGRSYIFADPVDPKALKLGDKVMIYYPESDKGVEIHEVVGFGKEGIYAGYPYTNRYGNPETYKKNPNNYILESVRVADPNASLTWH